MHELPTISSSLYGSSTVDLAFQVQPVAFDAQQQQLVRAMQEQRRLQPQPAINPDFLPRKAAPTMRIVKVIIADTNENLPLDRRLLYTGDEQLTDLTDQELFYEVGITEMLTTHNVSRLNTVDKKASAKAGRDVMLEPIRIRDLKMVVVTVASF